MLHTRKIQQPGAAATRIFLGGTCGGFDWREEVKSKIHCDFFDPFVRDGDWTEEHYKQELEERKMLCSHVVYVITPASSGFYAIAELMEDSMNRPDQTFICFLDNGGEGSSWDDKQKRSITKTCDLIRQYHNNIADSLEDLINEINKIA